MKTIRQYNQVAEERRQAKAKLAKEKMEQKAAAGENADSEDDKDEEAKDQEKKIFVMANKKNKTTIRNLRIREDTAKYLQNLDVNSAFYDPKTRSMRENPNPDKSAKDDPLKFYSGDNVNRRTGEAIEFAKQRLFTWEGQGHGANIHIQGAPSQAELLHKQYQEKKEKLKNEQQNTIYNRCVCVYQGESLNSFD